MVGIKKSKLILGIFIPILAFFLMSYNNFASAITVGTASYNMYYSTTLSDSNAQRVDNILPGWNNRIGLKRFYWYEFKSNNLTPTGDYGSVHFETNVVFNSSSVNDRDSIYTIVSNDSYKNYQITNCWWGSTRLNILSRDVSTAFTKWTGNGYNTTLTIYGDVTVGGIPNTNSPLVCHIASTLSSGVPMGNYAVAVYFEQNPLSIIFTGSQDSALLETQIQQNNTIINQNQEVIDQNNQAYDNISNQSSDDIGGSTNNQTTSLINVITGFIGAFSGINATNCNLTLEFPDYAGGSRIVNICSGKEKAPRIVEIGSSLLLICVFVPLAYVLIRMIYNEIRSWTNG